MPRTAEAMLATAVIIAPTNDVHARSVQREAHAIGIPCEIIDFAHMGQGWTIATTERGRLSWSSEDGQTVSPTSIWWRRPLEPLASSVRQDDVRAFSRRSSMALAVGALQSAVSHHINPLEAEYVVGRKPYQLWLANDVGLLTPQTLITNNPAEARAFLQDGRNIYKTVTTWQFDMKETRLVTEDLLADLDSIRECPVIFQRFVDGSVEARVTVVGDQIFTAVGELEPERYYADARFYHDRLRPGQLPPDVEGPLREFHSRAGLVYGAYDFRQSADGDWVFLEVNPAGQFMFVEIQTEMPISRAIAENLARTG